MALDSHLPPMSITELFGQAEALEAGKNVPAAVTLYKNWIARNSDHQLLHAVYFNYGVTLNKSGDRYGAMNALRTSLGLKDDFLPAHINLGRLLEDDGQIGAAVSQWLKLLEQTGGINGNSVKHKLIALQQLGRVLEGAQQDPSAEDALRQSLEISDNQPEVIQHWIALRQRQCKWPAVEGWEHVSSRTLIEAISPLSLATLGNDPVFQLARAFKYSKALTGRSQAQYYRSDAVCRPKREGEKLRIGYVSSDLREHAVGFAMADVLETHDRAAFEISAYYCGIDRPDPTQARAKQSVDRWLDIRSLSDEAAAKQIFEDRIDILVDLNGYTKDARSRIFAFRPAPVVVNWFGFPGTMGSPHHNYVIADAVTIPEGDEIFYSEKVLRLPCYQPNDRKRVVAKDRPSRSAAGLPDEAFVYCCLNGCQKITPETFRSWMEILRRVRNSVLWLLSGGNETDDRLKQAAVEGGLDADRLVFAEKMANPQHLARYALADLFLDTFPYGAHTTASDAMWMGVPVLTLPGNTFASRVCASLVSAAGTDEMVCADEVEYIHRATAFGRDPRLLKPICERLNSGRSTCTLFDTALLVREIEKLYCAMWADAVAGTIPKPSLHNLNEYFEIGVELALQPRAETSRDGLCAKYLDELCEWNASQTLLPDSRLWNGTSIAPPPSTDPGKTQ